MSVVYGFPPSRAEIDEDELPMTMQIAMIAADGIVLASDTKVYTPWFDRRKYGEISDAYAGDKILISDTGTMAVSCAIDMIRAAEVAKKIMSERQHDEDGLRNISQIVSTFSGGPAFECIVASLCPIPRIVRISYMPTSEKELSMFVVPASDRLCAGDHGNPSKFWHLRYYDRSLSVDSLSILAAQLIVDAAYFNSGTVGGLAMVKARRGGRFEFVAQDECSALETAAKRRSADIKNLVFPSGSAR
jgi:hypothetical protein